MSHPESVRIHPTAMVEQGVALGEDTSLWDGVHIRRGARLGRSVIVGEKTYIACDVVIGDFVKINASVYICAGVTVEDFCMISAHTVFTNDRFPRAGNVALTGLETSEVTEQTLETRVLRGTTIGANATIGPGLKLGPFAMVGMGAVVTRDVQAFRLVVGNPARGAGWVCVCGQALNLPDPDPHAAEDSLDTTCARCERSYHLERGAVTLVSPEVSLP